MAVEKRRGRPVSRMLFDAFSRMIRLQDLLDSLESKLEELGKREKEEEKERGRKTHEEKENDTDEILPVRRLSSSVGKSDSDKSGSLHDPGERVPHEGLEKKESRGKRSQFSARDDGGVPRNNSRELVEKDSPRTEGTRCKQSRFNERKVSI